MYASIKNQLLLLGVSTILSGFSLGAIIAFADPYESSWPTLAFFYASLFLVILGLLTVTGLFIRTVFFSGLYAHHLLGSFRQAFLVSLLVVASLMLQAGNLLFWWVELTLVLFLVSIESFFNLKT